jgi:hypothetical protein
MKLVKGLIPQKFGRYALRTGMVFQNAALGGIAPCHTDAVARPRHSIGGPRPRVDRGGLERQR